MPILTLLLAVLFVTMTAAAAEAGTVNQELEQLLSRMTSDMQLPVIIRFREQVSLGKLLAKAVPAERKHRPGLIARELREHAARVQSGSRSELERHLSKGRVKQLNALWIANSLAVTATPEVIREMAQRTEVSEVVPDRVVKRRTPVQTATSGSSDWNLSRVGVPALWGNGFRGQGVVVATLDSGVDVTHPDIGPKWRGGNNSWLDPFTASLQPYDGDTAIDVDPHSIGHGTSVMGIIVGGDSSGSPIGVAPDAKWIAAKVFDDSGATTYSAIHQGFQWLLNPDGNAATDDAPDVVNCSWTLDPPGVDPEFRGDVQAIKAAGIALVFAAGNDGPQGATSSSPANYPEALSVGATDSLDRISSFSSRGPGPALYGSLVYPVLTAPGEAVRSASLWTGVSSLSYQLMSGTSFAAPHLAGAYALLESANRALGLGLTEVELESALRETALDLGEAGDDSSYGSGLLAVDRAAQQLGMLNLQSPSGDADGDGAFTLRDVLTVLRAATGNQSGSIALSDLLRGADVAPLGAGGIPEPDGLLDLRDLLVLLRKYLGVITW